MRTRAEHLEWCKQRAMEYCDRGDPRGALTSMFSDLNKHPETEDHPGAKIGVIAMVLGDLGDPVEARRFIEGFH
jgi:hypothetical protein